MVSLCHQDTAKKLIVKVIKARNLVKTGFVGKADPYVKMALWHKDKLIEKAKTDTVKNSQNPVFNSTGLVFFDLPELDEEGLKSIKLEFTVMDEDWGKDDVIGRLVIGGENCGGSGLHHWNKVIAKPLVETEVWHPLSESGVNTIKPVIEEKEPPVIETDSKDTQEENKAEPSTPTKEQVSLKFSYSLFEISCMPTFICRSPRETCWFHCATRTQPKSSLSKSSRQETW